MKTKALRLYGASDIRLEEFELPEIKDDEILVEVISDSICMSTYKCAILGAEHKRVPKDVMLKPIILGHEFAGNIVKVGKKHQDIFTAGTKFTLQPALNYKGTMWSPGYSYQYFGGDATYCIIPPEVMELNCLLEYKGDAYYEASLAEPMSCSIGAFHANYHTSMGDYNHRMGVKKGGKTAILAGAGPMGLGAIDYAINGGNAPSLLVVTDIDQKRLDRAASLFPPKETLKKGVRLEFINTSKFENTAEKLVKMSDGGFDDVFIYVPSKEVIEIASRIAGRDCCINFFAGPADSGFSAELNFYNVHYNSQHVMGTTGGNTQDMIEALDLAAAGKINPAYMVTHIGGLDCAGNSTLNLPSIPGGKKLIYTHINLELTDIMDFRSKGENDYRFGELADIVEAHNGLWCPQAEKYLLENWKER